MVQKTTKIIKIKKIKKVKKNFKKVLTEQKHSGII